MNTTDLIKHTMIASLGLVMTHSTDSVRHFVPSEVKYHSIFTNAVSPSSTRFNNPQRFSLEQLKFNKRKLEAFKHFKQGWNGYGATPIDDKLISKIESLISDLDYQPQIFPTGRGSIQIEKYLDENNLVEIEISNDGVFAYVVKNGKELEKEISILEINDFISELYT